MKYSLVAIYSLLFLLMGCSAYLPDFYYQPHPGSVQIAATQPTEQPAVSVFATVVGIRKADDSQHIPLSVELRLRLDNHSAETVAFDPKSVDLTAGDLQRFEHAVTDLQSAALLEPGKSMVLTANFPFPNVGADKPVDLDTLQLRLPLKIGSRNVAAVLNFQREDDGYYGSYYGYRSYSYQPYIYPFFRSTIIIHRR